MTFRFAPTFEGLRTPNRAPALIRQHIPQSSQSSRIGVNEIQGDWLALPAQAPISTSVMVGFLQGGESPCRVLASCISIHSSEM